MNTNWIWSGIAAVAIASAPALAPYDAADASFNSSDAEALAAAPRVHLNYGSLPLHFEANRGQADEQVLFLARTETYTLFLTRSEAVLALRSSHESDAGDRRVRVLRMRFVGGNASPNVTGAQELTGRLNYFIGNDPARWRKNVPTYARVRCAEVYPGVDLEYYGNQRRLERDFIVAPGADPSVIRFSIEGAEQLRVTSAGDLVLYTGGAEVTLHAPITYQQTADGRHEIESGYVVEEGNIVRFRIGAYDPERPLVIDPVLIYSTYLGGGGPDRGYDIAVDDSGNVYVTGKTLSTDFPTVDPIQPQRAPCVFYGCGYEAFITKINAAGTAIIYSTYLGASRKAGEGWYPADDTGSGIAVDAVGNVYVTGTTEGEDFPTVNPLFGSVAYQSSGYVAKIDSSGSALLYSTYLSGPGGATIARDIAVMADGTTYVTGYTRSAAFPTTPGAFQTLPPGGGGDNAFVTKLNSSGTALIYSTYLGGTNGADQGYAIAVGTDAAAYVTGTTTSTIFPTLNAVQTTRSGSSDGFVTKLSADGSSLGYSTYLGGNGGAEYEGSYGIAVAAAGNACVAGRTNSTDFPTTPNPIKGVQAGGDAFVTCLDPSGSPMIYSTYLGGSSGDWAMDIAMDGAGNVYVTGGTDSTNFPTVDPIQGSLRSTPDGFVVKIDATGSTILFSSYLGGGNRDNQWAASIALDDARNAFLTGYTLSADFPTANPIQPTFGGGEDAFVTKIQTECLTNADCGNADPCSTDVCNPADPAANGFGCLYAPVDCDDGNICTDDTCNPSSGCEYVNNTAPCDDGQPCTTDVCTEGTCVGTPDAAACLEHFTFYKVRTTAGSVKFIKFGPVKLADQFGQTNYNVLGPKQLGLPADKNNEGTVDSATHLTAYKIKAVSDAAPFSPLHDISIRNQCNDMLVEVKKPVSLLVPASKDLVEPVPPPDPSAHQLDHFLCYKAKVQKKLADGTKLARFPRGIQVDVTDQFQTRRYDVKKITKLCNPVDKGEDPLEPPVLLSGPDKGTAKTIEPASIHNSEAHLVCYRIKAAKNLIPQAGCGCDRIIDSRCKGVGRVPAQAKHTRLVGIHVNDQFGPERLDTIKEMEICIPSLKSTP